MNEYEVRKRGDQVLISPLKFRFEDENLQMINHPAVGKGAIRGEVRQTVPLKTGEKTQLAHEYVQTPADAMEFAGF